MQLHYSHKLMQPEGHLGALFSIYECILYICVRARARNPSLKRSGLETEVSYPDSTLYSYVLSHYAPHTQADVVGLAV